MIKIEKNGFKLILQFNENEVKLAILRELSKGEKSSKQLRQILIDGLVPDNLGRVEIVACLMKLDKEDGLLDSDYKKVSGRVVSKVYKLKSN